jgi:hypothetical protein
MADVSPKWLVEIPREVLDNLDDVRPQDEIVVVGAECGAT